MERNYLQGQPNQNWLKPANEAWQAGYDAYFHEEKTRDLVYNPHPISSPLHNRWDDGYQCASDEARTYDQAHKRLKGGVEPTLDTPGIPPEQARVSRLSPCGFRPFPAFQGRRVSLPVVIGTASESFQQNYRSSD